ncbi:kinase-like domain-containing protein [Thelephora terrestris]|uniref:Kinase-like domain-containing protein n=1 Tax=Thelephora terrestris TaxID=56493 RepID=A0A9P6HEF0_9AGAM|nr:kinase-like domain-containing protein [Thelephora terrestris]
MSPPRSDYPIKELANRKEGPKGDSFIELSQLCTLWHTVPTTYELGGVVKQGDCALHAGGMTEIRKGVYDGEVVALKVLRLHRGKGDGDTKARKGFGFPKGDSDITIAKERFCAAAVLMKQIEHANIIPFYGVSTTTSDFSLVFPWYENGDIGRYLEQNPDVDRYDLLLGVVKGLRFLHSTGAVYGAFRPDHILIDDDGNARLAFPIPDTPNTTASQSSLFSDFRSESPVTVLEDFPCGVPETKSMKSDVYELAIVIYEVLTGIFTYWERYDYEREVPLMPARPPGAFDDLFWGLLAKCWRRRPRERPPIDEVYRMVKSRPKVNRASLEPLAARELQTKYELHVHGIKFPNDRPPSQEFYVKFKYGDKDYTTPLTNLQDDRGEYIWHVLRPFQLPPLPLSLRPGTARKTW